MQLYDADAAHWTFLTGPTEQVDKVLAAWGMWAKPAANGQLDHPSRVFLLDGAAASARFTTSISSSRRGCSRTSNCC